MERSLWKEIIEESDFDGVSIPFMVGKFYSLGFITEKELQTPESIRLVLANIIETASVGSEAAVLLCNKYVPYIPMIQKLSSMDRNESDVRTLKENNPTICNIDGTPILYLHTGMEEYATIEKLTQYFWQQYEKVIRSKKFSVSRSHNVQPDGTYHIWE